MFARGLSVGQISAQIEDIYGFEVSEGIITAITNKLLPEFEMWQKRPLIAVYMLRRIEPFIIHGVFTSWDADLGTHSDPRRNEGDSMPRGENSESCGLWH